MILSLLLSWPLQQSASSQKTQWRQLLQQNYKLLNCQAMQGELLNDRYVLRNHVMATSIEDPNPQEILAYFLSREECKDAIEQVSRNQFACLISKDLIGTNYIPYNLIIPHNLPFSQKTYHNLSHDECIEKGKEMLQQLFLQKLSN